jgi:hypothetical protein
MLHDFWDAAPVPRFRGEAERMGRTDGLDASAGMRQRERERVEQKGQKIGKYEAGSEQVMGALIEVHQAWAGLPGSRRGW